MPRTFMEGAMQGYGFMDDIIARRQRRQERLEQQRFQNRMTRRADSRAQERLEMEKQQASQQQAAQALEGLLVAVESGADPDPELIRYFEQNLGETPFRYLMPEHRRSIQQLETVAENPRKINTPEGLEAFNTVYGPQLNKNLGGQGQQGGRIKGKRAAAIVPGRTPGTFAVDLAVDFEHDDGRAGSYPAPATVGRGTEPDAQVLEVDAEKAAESLAGKSAVSEILNTPEVRNRLTQWYVALGGDPDIFRDEGEADWRSAGDGVLYNARTAETRRIPGYSEDLSEREKEVQNLVGRGIPEDWANDVAAGNVTAETDQFGRTILTNKATGTRKILSGDSQRGGPADTRQAEPVPIQPQSQEEQNLFRAVEETGPRAWLRSAGNNIIGPFMEGVPFEQTAASKQQLRQFNYAVQEAFRQDDGRLTNFEREIIQRFLPDPDRVFTDPDAERIKLREMRTFLQRQKGQLQGSMDQTVTMKERGTLANQIQTIDRILNLMGQPDAGGIGSMSIKELQSLDPSQLSDDELRQADERWEQLQGGAASGR